MNHRLIHQSIPADWPSRIAFEVRHQEVSFSDVLQGSAIRGDLEPWVNRSRHAHACEQRALKEGREPDMEAVEEMMNEFRYSHGLVTVEETEAWLDALGLTPDGLSDHFLRRYWIIDPTSRAPLPSTDPESTPPAWTADLLLTGNFNCMARTLAREMACVAGKPALADATRDELLAEFRNRSGLDAEAFSAWMDDWGLAEAQVVGFFSGQRQIALDRQEVLSPARRAGMLAEFRSPLARLELAVVQFDSEATAAEAYLCVTSDGQSLEDLASETGYPLRNEVAFLRELPESWHPALLGALPGRTLPPLPRGELFEVCRVIHHSEPRLDDPAVIAELDGVLLERHFGRLETQEIRWRIPMEGAA